MLELYGHVLQNKFDNLNEFYKIGSILYFRGKVENGLGFEFLNFPPNKI